MVKLSVLQAEFLQAEANFDMHCRQTFFTAAAWQNANADTFRPFSKKTSYKCWHREQKLYYKDVYLPSLVKQSKIWITVNL